MKRVLCVVISMLLVQSTAWATWSIVVVDRNTGRVVIASATCAASTTPESPKQIQAVVVPGKGVVGAVETVGKPSVVGEAFSSSWWKSAFCADSHQLRRFPQRFASSRVHFRETRTQCPNRVDGPSRSGTKLSCRFSGGSSPLFEGECRGIRTGLAWV